MTHHTSWDFIFWIYCSNTQAFCFLKVNNYLPLGFFLSQADAAQVLPNDSRCSCGKPLETKEEQKNPLTELWYHAITLVSLCRGMLLVWCWEITWNYLNCLYIIPEKWVHLGHKVWAFASICSALVHREQIFKDFVEKWIIQKVILSLSLSSKSSRSRSQNTGL